MLPLPFLTLQLAVLQIFIFGLNDWLFDNERVTPIIVLSKTICSYPMQTLYSKTPRDNFPSYVLIFIIEFQYTIIICYALLINNILISFDHPICNLRRITFLIIPSRNVSRLFPFCFTFGLVNSPLSVFLCF